LSVCLYSRDECTLEAEPVFSREPVLQKGDHATQQRVGASRIR
jgi:hypothetical protein